MAHLLWILMRNRTGLGSMNILRSAAPWDRWSCRVSCVCGSMLVYEMKSDDNLTTTTSAGGRSTGALLWPPDFLQIYSIPCSKRPTMAEWRWGIIARPKTSIRSKLILVSNCMAECVDKFMRKDTKYDDLQFVENILGEVNCKLQNTRLLFYNMRARLQHHRHPLLCLVLCWYEC